MTKLNKLRSTLLAIGGESVNFPDVEEDLNAITARAIIITPSKGVIMMKVRDSQCHENSALCWEQNKKLCTIMTGYALLNKVWSQHSWLLHEDGRVIETTVKRDSYYGFKLTPIEMIAFYDNNCA